MKLEPIKKAKLPRYAAALGILASAALLTGCSPVQTAGDVAAPIDSADIVELAGEEAIAPDWTEPTDITTAPDETELPETSTEPMLEGEAMPDPCITERYPDAPGTVAAPDEEPVMLEGDVAWIPDYQQAVDDINRFYGDVFGSYETGFAAKGFIMTRDETEFDFNGIRFTSVLKHKDRGIRIAFYDGTASENGKNMHEMMQEVCDESFGWGCVTELPADDEGYHRVIFVDMCRDMNNPIEDAEQIYKDVIA